MPEPVPIDDALDPRLAPFADIRERELAARSGLFVGETLVVLDAMLLRPASIRAVLASARMLERTRLMLDAARCEAPLYTASDEALEQLTGVDLHRGVLALGERAPFEPVAPEAFNPATPPRTALVAEDITNIDNIGQLFRIAAAFAVDAVVLSPSCHDPLYRKSLRVSTGNALKVPSIRARRWPDDLEELCARFGWTLVATAIQSSVPLRSVAPPERVAVVVGHESNGVSAAVRGRAAHIVRIPMAAGVDSLNVAVSAAIALDHFSRGERI
ncbi:MAG: RNA methyltransferase [Phycisphaera sp.]|nr:RNA methyltransferase [Phycisphaera sp.]